MCKIKDSTKKLLGVALLSGAAADTAAYTNLFTKTSHYEGNKLVAKIGLGVMAASLVAAYINEKCDIKIGQNDEVIDDNFEDFDDDFESSDESNHLSADDVAE